MQRTQTWALSMWLVWGLEVQLQAQGQGQTLERGSRTLCGSSEKTGNMNGGPFPGPHCCTCNTAEAGNTALMGVNVGHFHVV